MHCSRIVSFALGCMPLLTIASPIVSSAAADSMVAENATVATNITVAHPLTHSKLDDAKFRQHAVEVFNAKLNTTSLQLLATAGPQRMNNLIDSLITYIIQKGTHQHRQKAVTRLAGGVKSVKHFDPVDRINCIPGDKACIRRDLELPISDDCDIEDRECFHRAHYEMLNTGLYQPSLHEPVRSCDDPQNFEEPDCSDKRAELPPPTHKA